jgi:hypothetical protein
MVWSDLTNTDLEYSFTIAKASQTITASKNSVSLTAQQPSDTVTISGQQTSLHTPSSSDPSVATASESSGVITITGVATGNATISVYAEESANYEQSNTVNITADVLMNLIKTITVYSAASDTVSFTDAAGSKTVTTNSSGSGTVSVEINPSGQNITFTSSVAKNPSNLSNAYSKTVTVNTSTTSVYVMPSNVCYWWGYKSSEYVVPSTTAGWSITGVGGTTGTLYDPTEQTNRVSCVSQNAGSGNGASLIGFSDAKTGSKVCLIAEGVTILGTSYGTVMLTSSKNVGNSATDRIDTSVINSNNQNYYEVDISSYSSKYITAGTYNGRASYIYALWCE